MTDLPITKAMRDFVAVVAKAEKIGFAIPFSLHTTPMACERRGLLDRGKPFGKLAWITTEKGRAMLAQET